MRPTSISGRRNLSLNTCVLRSTHRPHWQNSTPGSLFSHSPLGTNSGLAPFNLLRLICCGGPYCLVFAKCVLCVPSGRVRAATEDSGLAPGFNFFWARPKGGGRHE